jgi:hypothetical protein
VWKIRNKILSNEKSWLNKEKYVILILNVKMSEKNVYVFKFFTYFTSLLLEFSLTEYQKSKYDILLNEKNC